MKRPWQQLHQASQTVAARPLVKFQAQLVNDYLASTFKKVACPYADRSGCDREMYENDNFCTSRYCAMRAAGVDENEVVRQWVVDRLLARDEVTPEQSVPHRAYRSVAFSNLLPSDPGVKWHKQLQLQQQQADYQQRLSTRNVAEEI